MKNERTGYHTTRAQIFYELLVAIGFLLLILFTRLQIERDETSSLAPFMDNVVFYYLFIIILIMVLGVHFVDSIISLPKISYLRSILTKRDVQYQNTLFHSPSMIIIILTLAFP